MQQILLMLAIGAFTSLAAATMARAEVLTNTRIPFTGFTGFVPCANGGAGEFIAGAGGELHILVALTENGKAVSGRGHFQPQGATAVGLNTGDIYHATGVTQNGFRFSRQNSQTETYVNSFRMIGPGPGNNFLLHQSFHVTISANGDTTVVNDHFSIECR
jgi:hypothetical protein